MSNTREMSATRDATREMSATRDATREMSAASEQFVQIQKSAIDSIHATMLTSMNGFERLAELNLKTARDSLEESTEAVKSMLDSKDPKALADSVANRGQPATNKMAAYTQDVYEIANDTGRELVNLVEKQLSNSGFDQASKAIKQAVDMADENFTTATKAVRDATPRKSA